MKVLLEFDTNETDEEIVYEEASDFLAFTADVPPSWTFSEVRVKRDNNG